MIVSAFKTSQQPQKPTNTLLVIGVHREELAFGEAVVERLEADEIDCLRVAGGVSARRPRPDQLATYLDDHARLYGQIAETAANGYELLIDLHCRRRDAVDADVFSCDPFLLEAMVVEHSLRPALQDSKLRFIRMVTDEDLLSIDQARLNKGLYAKPEMPDAIWRAQRPIYIGLEIYLDCEGEGHRGEWTRALDLITLIRKVVLKNTK